MNTNTPITEGQEHPNAETMAADPASQEHGIDDGPPVMWKSSGDNVHCNHPSTRTLRGSFLVDSTMQGRPKIKCDYLVPLNADGSPLASAADMVAIFPFPTQACAIDGNGMVLTTQHGFTIFSLEFPDLKMEQSDDVVNFYYYPKSGSGAAWLSAWKHVREIFSFPDRKLLLYGQSGGASAAHQFAEAYPDQVDSYVIESGNHFVDKESFGGPALIAFGEFDHTAESNWKYLELARKSNMALEPLPFQPNWDMRGKSDLWTHGIYDRSPDIYWTWLDGIANMRQQNHGKISDLSQWKQVNDLRFPDETSAEVYRNLNPPLAFLTATRSMIMAKPSQSSVAKAVILLLNTSFSADAPETYFDAQRIADDGYVVVAQVGEDGDPQETVSQIETVTTAAQYRDLPQIFVFYQKPSSASEAFLKHSNHPPLLSLLFSNSTISDVTLGNLLDASNLVIFSNALLENQMNSSRIKFKNQVTFSRDPGMGVPAPMAQSVRIQEMLAVLHRQTK